MRRAGSFVLAIAVAGCARGPSVTAPSAGRGGPCPSPFATDAPREARIVTLFADDAEAREALRGVPSVCFGPSEGLGVLVGGRPMLDAKASDAELAGRLAHLGVHLNDGLGDGCLVGLSRAIASEQRAHALETRVRAHVGLGPLPDDGRATADYTARCGR